MADADDLRDPRTLPHYILATLADEQPEDGFDKDLHARNRALWNRWATQHLDDEALQALIDAGRIPAEDVADRDMAPVLEAASARGLPEPPAPTRIIDFWRTTWRARASFEGFYFPARTAFNRSAFAVSPAFQSATFEGGADFESATFQRIADFQSATFKSRAAFQRAAFEGSTSFLNVPFKGPARFDGARFHAEPPEVSEATLHEGTQFHAVEWPAAPRGDPEAAERHADAYSHLKRKMEALKRHELELFFFAKELAALRHCPPRGRAWLIALYGAVSDYGRSVWRPIATGAAVWYAVAIAYRLLAGWDAGKAVGFSAASLAGVLGARREVFAPEVLRDAGGPVQLLSTGQSVVGAVLIFLIGLALRNRFRIR